MAAEEEGAGEGAHRGQEEDAGAGAHTGQDEFQDTVKDILNKELHVAMDGFRRDLREDLREFFNNWSPTLHTTMSSTYMRPSTQSSMSAASAVSKSAEGSLINLEQCHTWMDRHRKCYKAAETIRAAPANDITMIGTPKSHRSTSGGEKHSRPRTPKSKTNLVPQLFRRNKSTAQVAAEPPQAPPAQDPSPLAARCRAPPPLDGVFDTPPPGSGNLCLTLPDIEKVKIQLAQHRSDEGSNPTPACEDGEAGDRVWVSDRSVPSPPVGSSVASAGASANHSKEDIEHEHTPTLSDSIASLDEFNEDISPPRRGLEKRETLFTNSGNPRSNRPSVNSLGLLSLDSAERWRALRMLKIALGRCVRHENFDYFIGILICLNAVAMGVQTEYEAKAVQERTEEPLVLRVISLIFCAIFSAELLLRLFVHGRRYFTSSDWRWNFFDLFVVSLQLAEEIISGIMSTNGVESSNHASLSFVRILRVLRLVRIVRIMRIMHLLRDLRSMIGSVISTFRSLLWTIVLLLLIVYIAGVYLTQMVSDFGRDNPEAIEPGSKLHKYYGSIGRSILSLFQAISGGINWHVICDPLMEEISPAMALLFSVFIAFTMFSMLNVITGIFVESALKSTKEETNIEMVDHLRSAFATHGAEMISWQEFKKQLNKPELEAYFKSIDLDLSEAWGLFDLLDIEETGNINVEDFVMGCLRLRGPAKAIDLATLMSETRRMKYQLRMNGNSMKELTSAVKKADLHPQAVSRQPTDAAMIMQRQSSHFGVQRQSSR